MEWDELHETGKTWRVRARLLDRPGALARLATRLSEQGCNLLGVSVLPVAGESTSLTEAGHVVDEFVLRAPAEMRQGELITMIEAQGAAFVGMSAASVDDLVDAETAVLRAARAVLSGHVTVTDAVRLVLGADGVRHANSDTAADLAPHSVTLQDGAHVAVVDGGAHGRLVVSRGWAPFTEGELARVPALFDLLATTDRRPDLPRAVVTDAGSGVTLRVARGDDIERLIELHRKCSAATLFARYHAGMRRLPRGWAERLLSPPRGRTLLAVAGREVIGFAQLIRGGDTPDAAELSLLVQDEWQRQGVGTALLLVLYDMARAEGIVEMTALYVADSTVVLSVAARAGLPTEAHLESGLTRVTIPVEPVCLAGPFGERQSGGDIAQAPSEQRELIPPQPPRQLSPLDAQFLNAETPTNPIHIGMLILLEPPAGELVTIDRLRRALESRLHLLPALRRRLQTVPLGMDLPYWIDSEVDVDYHVRESALPRPGTDEQLSALVSRLAQAPLDRSRPLWEAHLVSGLTGGRQALYVKIHHCVIDGVSGAEVMGALLDLEPDAATVGGVGEGADGPRVSPGADMSTVEALGRGAWHAVARNARLARRAPRLLPALRDLPGMPGRAPKPPRTPFNGKLGRDRVSAFISLPLAEVKDVKQRHGLTVNDVVMTLCAAALRSWLIDRDALPDADLVAGIPVSVRTAEELGTAGNKIGFMLASMPTGEADPVRRLLRQREFLGAAKQRFASAPPSLLDEASAAIPQALNGVASRAVLRIAAAGTPPFNVMVSNVPGPQLPLYLCGARVVGCHPISAISDVTGGLNITVMSQDGRLDVGIIAARSMVPDVWPIAAYLRDALTELAEPTVVEGAGLADLVETRTPVRQTVR